MWRYLVILCGALISAAAALAMLLCLFVILSSLSASDEDGFGLSPGLFFSVWFLFLAPFVVLPAAFLGGLGTAMLVYRKQVAWWQSKLDAEARTNSH